MGKKQSKPSEDQIKLTPKKDKTIDDEKLLKIGLGVGKESERLEGNFQMGWHRRCKKSYKPSFKISCKKRVDEDKKPLVIEEDPEKEENFDIDEN